MCLKVEGKVVLMVYYEKRKDFGRFWGGLLIVYKKGRMASRIVVRLRGFVHEGELGQLLHGRMLVWPTVAGTSSSHSNRPQKTNEPLIGQTRDSSGESLELILILCRSALLFQLYKGLLRIIVEIRSEAFVQRVNKN